MTFNAQAKCRYAECHNLVYYAKCNQGECHFADCRDAECCVAQT